MGTRWRGTTLAAAVALALSPGSAAAQPRPGVTIQTFQFKPMPIEVPAGSKVTFTNQDDITHTVTSGTPRAATAGSAISSPARGPPPLSS